MEKINYCDRIVTEGGFFHKGLKNTCLELHLNDDPSLARSTPGRETPKGPGGEESRGSEGGWRGVQVRERSGMKDDRWPGGACRGRLWFLL